MKKYRTLPLALAASIGLTLSLNACSGEEYNVDEEQGVVVSEVLDGNTIVLDDGLTVHLIGIASGNTMTKSQLEGIVGKTVTLTPDSQADITFSSYDDEVWAYVMLDETGECLNRTLLTVAGPNALETTNLNDSLASFQNLVRSERRKLNDTELAEKLNGSSFIIYGQSGDSSLFTGTGFFISDDGLALSCSHVVSFGNQYVVELANPDGKLSGKRYNIKRPLYAGDYEGTAEDYAIFYVDLDDNAKRSIHSLSLNRLPIKSGARTMTTGNPGVGGVVLPMSVSDGSVSALRPEAGRIQVTNNIGPGFSGGAMVNEYGEVIGLNQSIMVDPAVNSKYVMLTDINMVRKKLDELNEAYNGK